MKELTVFINARTQSSRIKNKMIRPFGDTTLLRLALEKLNQMTWAQRRYLCIAEEDLESYAEGLDNIEILWRNKEAVSKGDVGKPCFEHYGRFPTPWFMWINASHPFMSHSSYSQAYDVFQETDYIAYTSVTKQKVWMFDGEGEPITNKDPNVLSTKDGGYSYEANHAFHIANKEFFLKTGYQHWEMKKGSPYLIEVPEHEALDIDTPLDFNVCESLYQSGYPKGFMRDRNIGDVAVAPRSAGPSLAIGPFDPAKDDRTLIIGEVGCSHDGSLGTAHKFIDVASVVGVDVVKFQTHIADAESSDKEPFRVGLSQQDATRYDFWKRMEFTEAQWRGLKTHADDLGLLFMSSPFSVEAVDLLERVGVPAWKVGSGEITNELLLRRIGATGLPVIISTGMSFWREVDRAVALMKELGCPFALMQCSTMYPCPPESAGLNNLHEFKERYDVPVGFSSHSPDHTQCLAAVCYGAQIVEFHLTLSADMFGPDVGSSLTPEKAAELVRAVREIETMRAHTVNKDVVAYDLDEIRKIFFKSLVLSRAMKKGEVVVTGDLTARKPGTGIVADRVAEVVGRTVNRDLACGTFIADDDFE